MHALAAFVIAVPSQALLFDAAAFWLRSNVVRHGRTVGLAKGVSTGNQGHGLFVVHAHASKGVTHLPA